MIFKATPFQFKSLRTVSQVFFGGGHVHKVTNVIQTKHNPNRLKQLRGHEQLQLHMSEYAKDFYYIHKKQRKALSLYNIFSYLPTSITKQFANLVSDPKVQIASDQVFLPKISENSVPVYESVSEFPNTLRTMNKILMGIPVFALCTAHMPFLTIFAMGLHYFIYFKSTFAKASQRLVIKMQLLPETEQLIFQKITKTGCVRTITASVSDIQVVNPDNDPKYKRELLFERSVRNVIDINMVYRIKSTGEIIMFDREGVWHEEGINHQLMP